MNQDLKKTLWTAADKLRSSMDAAEYKRIVLRLIFVKYISDAFDERRAQLRAAFADEANELHLPDAGDHAEALRDKFFEQHAKRFHHRPFIWHVWDGLKDGFAALVNYHRLDAKNLERLIHTYLGDWIRQQEAGVRDGIDGAQTPLTYAQNLKRRLELILEGEKPDDIFVRWKTLAEQPIGWNPDLNDGVRLNIRPFMTAEVLRHNKKPKLNITWDKDRGKDVKSAPWFKVFQGERINDRYLKVAEKQTAGEAGRG